MTCVLVSLASRPCATLSPTMVALAFIYVLRWGRVILVTLGCRAYQTERACGVAFLQLALLFILPLALLPRQMQASDIKGFSANDGEWPVFRNGPVPPVTRLPQTPTPARGNGSLPAPYKKKTSSRCFIHLRVVLPKVVRFHGARPIIHGCSPRLRTR